MTGRLGRTGAGPASPGFVDVNGAPRGKASSASASESTAEAGDLPPLPRSPESAIAASRASARAPLIGACAALERARWSFWEQDAVLVPRSYHAAIVAAGGVTMPLVPDGRVAQDPDLVLDAVDALLLIGGADVDPSFYGEERDEATEATCPSRDAFEIALARRALERRMPLLGICRGMQILNVALGGTLVQDLTAEDGSLFHRRTLGGFDGTDHVVAIEPGSLAHRATGELRHVIRCHHHQAVGRLGDGVVVTGWAETDAVPEAVEAPGRGFVLGVQWHPEADERSRVIAALVDAAARTLQAGTA